MILHCKKTYCLHFYFKKSEKMFLKNHTYEAFFSKNQYPLDIIEVISEDNRRIMFNCNSVNYVNYYKKYFYTESEMRKMKLKRLNSPLRKIVTFLKQK